MAFKLTKTEAVSRAELVNNLTKSKVEVQSAIAAFNEAVEREWQIVQEMINGYNEHLGAAREFRDRIVEDRQTDWDMRSEKWQDGDRGRAAGEWIEAWENLALDDLEMDTPGEVEEPDMDEDENLGELPDAMDDE